MAPNKKLTESATSPKLVKTTTRGESMLLCDFHNIVGAKVVNETVSRVKVKYFDARKGEVVRWLDRNEVDKIYRYR
jgi:hypothetical protein